MANTLGDLAQGAKRVIQSALELSLRRLRSYIDARDAETSAAIKDKVDKETGKGLSTNDYTDAEKARLAELENYDDTQVRQLITQTNANFANYYTKAESYSATEVDTLLRTQRQGQYVVVNTLPTPSADTMFKIYLVPSVNPKTQNVKDEFVTLDNNGTYSWEQIGTTAVELSGYSTTEEMNAAIASALGQYYTKSEVDEALGGKQNTIDDLANIRSGARAGSTAYQKPQGGIPSTDMSQEVQTSLEKANTALQEHQSLDAYAKNDGYYETMGVGTANNLAGQTESIDNSKFRTSGGTTDIGTGTMHIDGVRGKSIVWSQLLEEGKLVDMGLPSGTLWASCNIDLTQPDGFATSPFQYGCSYFSWGNIEGHNPISTSAFDYDFGTSNSQAPWYEGQPYGDTTGNSLTTNIPANETYDAARFNIGTIWHIPTGEQMVELFNNIKYIYEDGTEIPSTSDKRITINGVYGIYIESTINGGRLFFPCAGSGIGTGIQYFGVEGRYWTSQFYDAQRARPLSIAGGIYPQHYFNRCIGMPIKPVISKSPNIQTGKGGNKYALSSNNKAITNISLAYGGANEPSTVAQFEADYESWFGKSIGDEPYNTGSLHYVQDLIYKTVGFNLLNPSTGKAHLVGTYGNTNVAQGLYCYEITGNYTSITDEDGNTITPQNGFFMVEDPQEITVEGADENTCIHLTWSGWRNGEAEPYQEHLVNMPVTQITGKLNGTGTSTVIFPDGMRSAGNAYDEIYISNDKVYAVKRIGRVDLGTLSWFRDNFRARSNAMYYTNIKGSTSCTASANALSIKYPSLSADETYMKNYGISIGSNGQGINPILVYDSNLKVETSTPAQIKAAMQGVILYYEYATPEVYEVDNFELPIRTYINDFGTEEQITEGIGADIVVKYAVNAVDLLRRLPENYISSESMDNFLGALGAAMKGTWTKTWNSSSKTYNFSFRAN